MAGMPGTGAMGAGMGAGGAFDPLAAYGYGGGYAAAQDPALFAQAQAVLQQYGGAYGAQGGMQGMPGVDPNMFMGGYGAPGAGLVGGPAFGGMPGGYGQQQSYGQREACADYARGRCERGASCKYAHGGKRETCGDFQNDRCTRGDLCRFIHERATCGDFNRGNCSRGAACRFAHAPHKKPSCRDFERGTCTRGDVCRFAHNGPGTAASTGVIAAPGTEAPSTGVTTSPAKRTRDDAEEEDANKRVKTDENVVVVTN